MMSRNPHTVVTMPDPYSLRPYSTGHSRGWDSSYIAHKPPTQPERAAPQYVASYPGGLPMVVQSPRAYTAATHAQNLRPPYQVLRDPRDYRQDVMRPYYGTRPQYHAGYPPFAENEIPAYLHHPGGELGIYEEYHGYADTYKKKKRKRRRIKIVLKTKKGKKRKNAAGKKMHKKVKRKFKIRIVKKKRKFKSIAKRMKKERKKLKRRRKREKFRRKMHARMLKVAKAFGNISKCIRNTCLRGLHIICLLLGAAQITFGLFTAQIPNLLLLTSGAITLALGLCVLAIRVARCVDQRHQHFSAKEEHKKWTFHTPQRHDNSFLPTS